MKNNNIGILDPFGYEINPLSGKSYSDQYKELAKKWSTYPAYLKISDIINSIKQNQVILCIAATGAGKTVIVPKAALHVLNYKGKIAITLPKTLTTQSAAIFSAKTLDVKIGEQVAYKYRGSPKDANNEMANLLYCTDGTLISMILKDPTLKNFDMVIMDEIHEASNNIHFLFYLLKKTLSIRNDFKLILMSATVNPEIFRNYYKDFKYTEINLEGSRTFPIKSIFLNKSLEYNEIFEEAYKILLKILESDDPTDDKDLHDIIFFVTSSNETFTICQKINKQIEEEKKIDKCKITCNGFTFCLELFSGATQKSQELAQDKDLYKLDSKFSRKLIIATNIAESSLTLPNIKFVINLGHELHSSYDPENRARKLDRQLISQASSNQRCGRAGRIAPGICYHMYTNYDFENKMKKFPEPSIRTSDITSECLKLLAIDTINTVPKLLETLTNFIEPPYENYIRSALNILIQLGAVENEQISKLGKLMNELPANDVMMSLSIILGKIYNCSKEVMKITSLIEVTKSNLNDIYILPSSIVKNGEDETSKKRLDVLEKRFNESRKKFTNKYGDHLSLLNIYDKFAEMNQKNDQDKLNKWAFDNFLKLNVLQKAKINFRKIDGQTYRVIKERLNASDFGLKYYENIARLPVRERVLCCLLMGYRLNTAVKISDSKFYRTQFSNLDRIQINKNSFLMLKQTFPKNVFYNEFFISMGRNDLNIVSRIPKNIIKILA